MHHEGELLAACYHEVFGGQAGRSVLEDLQARAFHRDSSFSPDPQRAAFNEGRRSLLLHVLRMLDGPPSARARAQQGLGEA
ncbi:hypothetical protein SAMN04488503_1615 [Humidesulfovibrio mexicanus]|uniref:Bbp19-like phage domain-containing protein n=1 Tax=Humidesulfovibrio mexicanus TaxID=147047 RepID=A0A238ZW02_9BACT|nr:hypothetical protein [Humidesulfovibrio mexicanus]SNR86954.1 hypothetical protein SAMN04488503_1615 [Humidesulfovibrio mexicanus]